MNRLDAIIGRRIEGVKAEKIVRLPWDNNIGAFIVGRPGSGKSHVTASLLTQYAIKDVAIAISEYNADPDNPDSLIYRTRHIHHLLVHPVATTGKEVSDLMLWLQTELKNRQSGLTARIPMVVVFDEFFAFSNTYKPSTGITRWKTGNASDDEGERVLTQKEPTYWEILMSILSDLRKNNIRVFMALQEPAASQGTTMRQARDMFRFKLIMTLGYGSSKLVGITDVPTQRIVNSLPPGFIFLRDTEDMVIGVPYPINPSWIDRAKGTLSNIKPQAIIYDWTPQDTEIYLNALFKYWTKNDTIKIDAYEVRSHIDTKDDLIRILVLFGKNNEFIKSVIKGNVNDTIRLANQYRIEYNMDNMVNTV